MVCFYHSDLDGECSAAIVLAWQKSLIDSDTVRLYPINYNIDFPFDKIDKDEKVWIVDYSLQRDGDWERLKEKTSSIVWIDHHKTAIEASNVYGVSDLHGLRDVGLAGCELTWNYCFEGINMPQAVRYVADYDVWRFEFGDDTKRFNNGISFTIDTRPESDFWLRMFFGEEIESELYEILDIGERIISKQLIKNASLLHDWGFEIDFEGYSCIGVNRGQVGSQFFESIGKNYDILIPIIFDGEQWTVSLYQSGNGIDIDLGELAKKYGGGGHVGAAGFQCKELPFEIKGRLS